MKGIFYFLLGVFCTVLFFATYKESPEPIAQPEVKEQPNIQYFDVTTSKGTFQLYTSMSKDSVRSLMGKPREINVYQIGDEVHEEWEYRGRNHYTNEFTIRFENGKLVFFMQDRE